MAEGTEQRSCKVANKQSTHVLMLLFPTTGHMTPMVYFALNVARHGAIVTLATFSHSLARLHSFPSHPNLRFASIPDSFSADDARDYLQLLYHAAEDFDGSDLDLLIERLNADEGTPRVCCIVYNHFLYWAQKAADKRIPKAMFWTQSASVFATYFYFFRKELEKGTGIRVPRLTVELGNDDLPEFVKSGNERAFRHFQAQFEGVENLPWVLANTFEELEEDAFHFIQSNGVNFLGVGPCVSPSIFKQICGAEKEEDFYLKWLDLQEESSVIYVSFGSITVLSQKQVEEIAFGILNSDVSFLWVVRGMADMIPQGFAEETKEKGIMVGWCDQSRVLRHSSVGGFLTHCGWNSSLESLCAGVPVATFPVWTDQKTNSKFLCESFRMGIRIQKMQEEETVARQEIERCLKLLVGKKEVADSAELRNNARKWKRTAEMSLSEGGSSTQSMSRFLQEACDGREVISL